MIVAVTALVVAMAGTGYAASKINGSSIKKNSVPGNRIEANSLGGKQVNESKLGTVPSAAQADSATNAETAQASSDANLLDGIDSAGFVQGSGKAFVNHGNANMDGVFNPDQAMQALGSIPGLGSFGVVGSNAAPGDDCRINFTNTSGASVVIVVNSNVVIGDVANGATVELVGIDSRPVGDNAAFTIMPDDGGKIASGQAAVNFGNNFLCAGAVAGLTND